MECEAVRKSIGGVTVPFAGQNPGRKVFGTLRASTLVETLVMMLVAGIVFLAAMDGLTLFTRLQTRRAETLLSAGRQRDGYFRLEALTAEADSILARRGELGIYRNGMLSLLSLGDSVLVYNSPEFRDTLLRAVAAIRLSGDEPDTLVVVLAEGFTFRFAVRLPAEEVYGKSLDEIEEGYDYEE